MENDREYLAFQTKEVVLQKLLIQYNYLGKYFPRPLKQFKILMGNRS